MGSVSSRHELGPVPARFWPAPWAALLDLPLLSSPLISSPDDGRGGEGRPPAGEGGGRGSGGRRWGGRNPSLATEEGRGATNLDGGEDGA